MTNNTRPQSHRIYNAGRYPIEVTMEGGAVVTVDPGNEVKGPVMRIFHGDRSANYTCEPVETAHV